MEAASPNIGAFTVDRALVVRTWDPWLARVTGVPVHAAHGRALSDLVPDLDVRGVLDLVREVITEGTVRVLAPTFHGYLIACPPQKPSARFEQMQQRVTIGALREKAAIIGAIVTIEDVTERLDRERDAAERTEASSPRDSAAVREAMRREDWHSRRHVTEQVARTGGQAMISSLLAALEHEHHDFAVTSSALQLLSQIDLDVVEPLIQFLRSPDVGLRIQATLGLGEQQDPRAVPALAAALDDADANVRFHAIEALGRLRATPAVNRLLEIAHSGDFFLAFAALDALSRIGDPRVAPLLVPLLDDEMLRNAAVDALGAVGDENAVTRLVALLDRDDPPAAAVAQALVSLHGQATERYGEGLLISDLARRHVTRRGIRALVNAVNASHGEALRALAIVLGWLEGEAVERTLARLLGDASARRDVVEALVRFGPRVTSLLVQQLSADSVEARQAAVIALGRIGDRQATGPLLDLLERDRDTIITTAGALARIGDPKAFERLLPFLTDPDAAVRQAVISALNSIGHPDMAQRVAALLEDADPFARESAVKIAGYFGYPGCVDAVIAHCSDPNEDVRRAALDALPFLEDRRVIPTLLGALRTGTPRARTAAVHALGRVEDPEAVGGAIEALADPDSWVRYFAARAVGRHRAAPAVAVLTHLIVSDPAMQVRLAGVEALGNIGTPDAVSVLAPLSQGEGDLATAALRALGAMRLPEALPPLRSAVEGSDPHRRLEAIRALATHDARGATALLEWAAAASPDPAIVREATAALAQLASTPGGVEGAAAVNALVDLTADPARREGAVAALGGLSADQSDRLGQRLTDPRIDVRTAVVEALSRMHNERATAHLRRALDDAAAQVRKTAVSAISHLGSRGMESRLSALARGDPDPSVRQAAAAALKHAGNGSGDNGNHEANGAR